MKVRECSVDVFGNSSIGSPDIPSTDSKKINYDGLSLVGG